MVVGKSDLFLCALFFVCCLFTVRSLAFTSSASSKKLLHQTLFLKQQHRQQHLCLYMSTESSVPSSHPFIRPILTENDFNALKEDTANGIVVIEFQKGNCKPCKKVAPLFDALANKYHDRATFCRMDAESGKETMQAMKKIGVKSVPTFYVYRNGERVDSISGARLDDLEMLINQELNKQS